VKPTVSIVIPTLNRAELLHRALASVLAQTYKDYEIIVVQNGPEECSKEIVQGFIKSGVPVRYVYTTKASSANARNMGVLESKGKYIAFLDDDDEWFPEKLNEQVSFLDQNKTVGLVACRCVRVKELDGITDILPEPFLDRISYASIIKSGSVIPSLSSILIRRECFDKVGFFNPDFFISDDHEFYLRVAARYEIFMLVNPLFRYYWHANNISKKSLRMYQEKIKILKSVRAENNLGVSQADIHRSFLNYGDKFYALATDCKDKKEYKEAVKLYLAALSCNPSVGLQISWSRFKNPLYRFLKPYGAIVACALKALRPIHD